MDQLAVTLLTAGLIAGALFWRFLPARTDWLALAVTLPTGGFVLSLVFC